MKIHKTRWNCKTDGCANVKTRLKFEVFDGIFPRNVNFSDLDGFVELNGALGLMEWKFHGSMPFAQERALNVFLHQNPRNILFVVYGNPEDMLVRAFRSVTSTKCKIFNPSSLQQLKGEIGAWAASVERTQSSVGLTAGAI